MKRKILVMAIAVIMVLSLFSGCKKNDENTLYVATNAEFAPWEFLKDGEIVGFDADLIKLVAEKMGMKVKFENMEFDSVLVSIASGSCDAAIAGLTINETRKKSVDFSTPYYIGASQILIVRENDDVFTGTTKEELDEQLKNKTIGVCIAFTGEAYAKGNEEWGFKGIEGADVEVYDNISTAAQDLKNGILDVIIMDDTVAYKLVETESFKGVLRVIDIPLTTEAYAIAVKKGNKDLLEKINKALKELEDEGKIKELFEKWEIDQE